MIKSGYEIISPFRKCINTFISIESFFFINVICVKWNHEYFVNILIYYDPDDAVT